MTIEERYAHWREVIEAQRASGLSIAEYCRHQNIRWLNRDFSNFLLPSFRARKPVSALLPALFVLKFSVTSIP